MKTIYNTYKPSNAKAGYDCPKGFVIRQGKNDLSWQNTNIKIFETLD